VRDTDELYERVRTIVDAVPPGRVTTYGDIAACFSGVGPRAIGRVMRNDSHDLPWWRVVNASGRPAPGGEVAARVEYDREGTPLVERRERPYRVDLRASRWTPPGDETHDC
jgi:alkylated DNA nucleotide flippase Atl1